MKKAFISILFIIGSLISIAQDMGDGLNDRNISQYGNDIEIARVSLTFWPGFDTDGQSDFLGYIDPDLPMNGGVSETDGEFNLNYVRIYHPLRNNSTAKTDPPVHGECDYQEWSETINYYDGLGRPIQTVNVKASSYGNDIIQPIIYDEFGRQKIDYLPYAIAQDGNNGPGGYRNNPIDENKTFYQNYYHYDGFDALAEKEFDGSPLNRVLKQGSPGNAWQIRSNGHYLSYEYNSNSSESIPILKVQNGNLINTGNNYNLNTLFKNSVIDENGNESIEYKDLMGNVILKEGEESTKTFYVYDKYNLLRYIIPPIAAEKCVGSSLPTSEEIDALCFYYEYDHRNRMILKKLPGAEPIQMVYNQADQLILSQDGNQLEDNIWAFTKYDIFGRPILNGMCTINSSIADIREDAMVTTTYEDFTNNSGFNQTAYSNVAFPVLTGQDIIHSVMYYDNYDVLDILFTDPIYDFKWDELDFLHIEQGYGENRNVKGHPTVSTTKVLLNENETVLDDLLVSVTYYNKYEQPIQTISDNHLGGYDIVSSRVNFTGDVEETKESHFNGIETINMFQRFNYDHAKRMTKVEHKTDENEDYNIVLSEHKYNELGQLRRKKLHNGLKEITHSYNIRGWLTEINNVENFENTDLFAMQLDYNTATHPQFNGNIGAISWESSTFTDLKIYDFVYDGLNRLTNANYSDYNKYTTSYGYDKNGNIDDVVRSMDFEGTAYQIDFLDYDYNGNQLSYVNDQLGSYYENYGFKDNGIFDAVEYEYDYNGNMTLDKNKGIDQIGYNYLNLPVNIVFNDGLPEEKSIGYIYTANGSKLRKYTNDASKESIATDYIGAFVYEEDELQFIQTAEGRLVPNENGGFHYEYALKDHLGNTRVMFNEAGEVLQDQSYYPFGMSMGDALTYNDTDNSPENKYLYNGKELQMDFDLGWYDYGVRFYDPTIGKWNSNDPYAEVYEYLSPYNYALNDPISVIDPDGNLVIYVNGFRKDPYTSYVFNNINPGHYFMLPPPWEHAERFHDHDKYQYWDKFNIDFWNGTEQEIYVDGMYKPLSYGTDRFDRGVKEGNILAEKIKSKEITYEDGEVIKLIGHSHGGAHAMGMAQGLLDSGIDPDLIYVFLFASHQPNQTPSVKVNVFQFFRASDEVSSKGLFYSYLSIIEGAEATLMPDGNEDGLGNHSIHTYTLEEVKAQNPKLYQLFVDLGVINEK